MPVFSNYNRCRPTLHHATHEVGGIDEIAGLGGTFTGRNGFDYTLKTDGTDIIAYDDEGTQVGSTRQDLAVLIETDLLPLKTTAAIKLTSGSFPLKTKLTLSKNFGLYGNGMHNTVILGVADIADEMLELTSAYTDIHNLHLDGSADKHFARCLSVEASGARIIDVQFSNVTGNGMNWGVGGGTMFTGGYLIRPRFNETCLGHELEILADATDIWIQGGNFRGYLDTNSCIKVGAIVVHIQNNHLWGRQNLIQIVGCDSVVIEGNWLDDCYHDGILCIGYLNHSTIVGNHFRWNGHGHVNTYGNISSPNDAQFNYNTISANDACGGLQNYGGDCSEYFISVLGATRGQYCAVAANALSQYHAASGSRIVLTSGTGCEIGLNSGA